MPRNTTHDAHFGNSFNVFSVPYKTPRRRRRPRGFKFLKNGIKRAFNWFLGVSRTFFGNRDDKPKVQLLIRWLPKVLLLNAAYISVPWRLGKGIKEVVGFGAGCTIAFITGRDGTMLQKRFDLLRQQQLGLLLTYAVFVVHAALFLLFPLFATTQTLLDRHAFVIALSLSVQGFV